MHQRSGISTAPQYQTSQLNRLREQRAEAGAYVCLTAHGDSVPELANYTAIRDGSEVLIIMARTASPWPPRQSASSEY